MGKINSRCLQLELHLQCGQGAKDKTVFHSSRLWVKEGLTRIYSGQNRERKLKTRAIAYSKLLQFFLSQRVDVNFMPLPWAWATWWHLFPTRWQLALHRAGPKDAREQLRCQPRHCQPHAQCQCKTTGSGHHPGNQANPPPQWEKQLGVLQNLSGYFLGQKSGFAFHFIQL